MKSNAAWLKANPKAKIRIEGNCDERGTNEYNQALGQRRATSAKKYLTDLGIAGSRISVISYGEEKPVCKSSNEDCWQKNRRDDFVETND
jgi:peptidoglycan-associated lipoprotein